MFGLVICLLKSTHFNSDWFDRFIGRNYYE